VQPPSSVATASFSGLLEAANRAAQRLEADCLRRGEEEGVLSLAVPLAPLDPLSLLPHLPADRAEESSASGALGGGFRMLWDSAPGLCLAASGRCNSLELSGPRRFELAQRFSSLSLLRLAQAPTDTPPLARPRVLLAFAFFDSPLEAGSGPAGLQAVLPRWQLSRQGEHSWLRLQRNLGGEITPRRVAEELWETARQLERLPLNQEPTTSAAMGIRERSLWQGGYRAALEQALALIEDNRLQKLVLAVRQTLLLDGPLDPLLLLAHLRRSQPGSCRFLWQQSGRESLLGASPERLLTVRQGQLRSDALAGTAPLRDSCADLLLSEKDRYEHALVVETIQAVLRRSGLQPRHPRMPRLARHGSLVHLHTPITAALNGQQALRLADALHPTPAVAGLPRREAMACLRSLEPFERGHYAAPIGWIDSAGDADLRVAIRSGVLRGQRLELTAGAGLVRGSQAERELREVELKLGVLRQQLMAVSPAMTASPG
jgi:menaquinone-specific isochorismate synthase